MFYYLYTFDFKHHKNAFNSENGKVFIIDVYSNNILYDLHFNDLKKKICPINLFTNIYIRSVIHYTSVFNF